MQKTAVKPREYKYTKLKSVQANTTVDIYGVIKFLKQPFKTRGRDYCMVVSLMDESCSEGEKLKCLLFNSDPNKLPDLKIGDVVRFHRLKISMFNNEEQGQSGPGFSWLVFSNQKEASMDPTFSVSSNYTFTNDDKNRIEELREWSAKKDELAERSRVIALENIIPQMYFDFICQVVATCYFEDDHCFVLRVWDGTVSTYELRKFEFVEELVPCFEQDLMKKADGFLVDVALYDDHCDKGKDKIKPGDFIKLTNLHAAVYKAKDARPSDIPTLELVLHRGNSFGRGFVSATDKILEEHLESVTHHVTENKNVQTSNTDFQKNKTGNGMKSRLKTSDEKTVEDSQQPSTSNYCRSKQPEKSSPKGKTVARTNPFAELLNNNGDKNVNVVTSTSVEEQKSSSNNAQDYQQMEMDISKDTMSQTVQSSGSRCMQQTLTVILGHPHVKVTKIKDVLSSTVPYKFRVLGHVDNIFPHTENVYDYIKLYCEKCNFLSMVPHSQKQYENLVLQKQHSGINYYFCPKCSKNNDLQNTQIDKGNESILRYIFMIRMKISDGTESITALLWGKEAVTFFKDIYPIDVLCSESLWHEIQEGLEDLCFPDKPLTECCVMSYTVDKQTKYQMFDTSLV